MVYITLRDVRVLRDHLAAGHDWTRAADAYAVEHSRYYSALSNIHDLWRELFFGVGASAETLRSRALPDPLRLIDFIGLGPEAPCDTAARRRFSGEE